LLTRCLPIRPTLLRRPLHLSFTLWWPTHPASGWVGYRLDVQGFFASCLRALVPTHFRKNGWATMRHLFPSGRFQKNGRPPCGICFPVAVFGKTGGPPCVFDTRLARHAAFVSQWPFSEKRVGHHSAFAALWSWHYFHSVPIPSLRRPTTRPLLSGGPPAVLNFPGGPPIPLRDGWGSRARCSGILLVFRQH